MSKKTELTAKMRDLENRITALVNKSQAARKEGRNDAASELLQQAATLQNEWKECGRAIDRLNPSELDESELQEKYNNARHLADLKARGLI